MWVPGGSEGLGGHFQAPSCGQGQMCPRGTALTEHHSLLSADTPALALCTQCGQKWCSRN